MSFVHGLSNRNRKRKYEVLMQVADPTPLTTVLDVGYTDEEYRPSDNFLEKHYPHPEMITALGVVEPMKFAKRYPQVRAVCYDGRIFPFEDKEFDVCSSNAVIEHVGGWEEQILFLKEIKRTSRLALITTPNKYFPVELHTRAIFLHYFPKRIFDAYLRLIGKKWATGSYMNLLSISQMRKLLKAAGIDNYKIIKNRLLGLTVDFVVVFGKGVGSAEKCLDEVRIESVDQSTPQLYKIEK